MNEQLLVFDIGTTGLKCALFDAGGAETASASIAYRTDYPQPGWSEQDPEGFWRAAKSAARKLFGPGGSCAGKAGAVAAIGLSGHMNGCLPVDAQGRPTHPEIIHSDSRSSAECAQILFKVPHDQVYALTGNRVDEHLGLSKILWLKNVLPDAYAGTAYFLNSKDYLRFKLTGVLGETDYSDASLVCALDLAKRRWSESFLKELGLDPAKFPRLRGSAEISGGLSAAAASALGLRKGIPVVAGGGDAACATRGAGVRDASTAYAYIGSSAWISTLAAGPVIDPAMRMQNFYDLDGTKCNVCGTVQSAGIAVDWAMGLGKIGPGKKTASRADYLRMEAAVAKVPPGSDGVVFAPYLMGERTPYWDASARGAFVGLSLYHGQAALMRAVFEGVAFALKDVLGVYRELGLPIQALTLLGGGAKSPLWTGIVRDVLALPVASHETPTAATSLGAAMAAGVGVGLYRNMDDAAAMARRGPESVPEAGAMSAYRGAYAAYASLYERLKPVYAVLEKQRSPKP